ncbi:MAG: hypothetical protein ACOX6L_12225, partial [Syntrophomonadaceae bacterium]
MGRRYTRRKINELRQSLLEEMKKTTQLEQVIAQLKDLEPLVNTLKDLEPMISVLNELAPRFDQIKGQVTIFNSESGLEVKSRQEQETEPGINSNFHLKEEVPWNPLTGFQECGMPDPIFIKKGQGN